MNQHFVLRASLASFIFIGLVSATVFAGEVSFDKQRLAISPNEGCAVGDVNNDGVLDIVAGSLWFAGPDWTPRQLRDIEEFQDDFYSNNGDHLYDVDGDGWLDVITAGWHEEIFYWYKNPGEEALAKGLKWEERVLAETRGQNEVLLLRDLDGDDVPEIYVSCWIKDDPQVCWKLIQDENGEPGLQRVVIGEDGGGHGFAFGDLNGDGLEDILTETGWYERPAGDPWAALWAFHGETALPHPSCPFVVVDLNEDGKNDIVWGKAHDFGLYYWEQGEPTDDGTTTWTEHLIDDSWSQSHCIVWADIDSDGQGELITGKRVRGHGGNDPGGRDPAVLYCYEWDADAEEFSRYAIGAPGDEIGTGMQLNVIDLNEDGLLDIAVAGKSGTWVLINEGE